MALKLSDSGSIYSAGSAISLPINSFIVYRPAKSNSERDLEKLRNLQL